MRAVRDALAASVAIVALAAVSCGSGEPTRRGTISFLRGDYPFHGRPFLMSADGSKIYAMNADGSGRTNLSRNPADDWAPSWVPHARRP